MQALQAQMPKRMKAVEPAPGTCTAPAPLADLAANATVLNATNDGALKQVLVPGPAGDVVYPPLKSDADEQLLVTINLPSAAKLHEIKISGPDDGTAPKEVKLFANKANMSFDDCEDFPATQTLEFSVMELPGLACVWADYEYASQVCLMEAMHVTLRMPRLVGS